ncbi:hypothetical protein SO802_018191 [Lithocarpus litseifolius]|uniref:Retrotransposon Copia-like N-terminal domain-containing protein n=1 Tax=Lithocarpus litseifolius TaxID=425828 RepID=A0AAW2CKN0_9ROSI
MAPEHEVTHPITIILDDSDHYSWSQNMIVFLKEADDDGRATYFETHLKEFETRLEEWESIQSKILTWFINTFVATINSLFPCLGTAKAA